ncbi:MAG: hypothetical protein IPL26_16125 [Leptospiraceae bacterium]|nr:hypothetical protein [Leptospiraceae bacterium]
MIFRQLGIVIFSFLFSNCFIFYPFVADRFEKESNAEEYALAALYFLSDKKHPIPGNNGILEKINPGNATFTLSWNLGLDDKTDSSNLGYKVYVSSSNNIQTVADMEANGEALTNLTNATLSSRQTTSSQSRIY